MTFLNRNKSTIKLYINFLFPYLLLLLLPISVLVYNSHMNYMDILQKEINTNYVNNLTMIQAEVDTNINSIRNTLYQMSTDSSLKKLIDDYNHLDRYNLIKAINKYKSYTKIAAEVILYKRGGDHILTSTCDYTIQEFINSFYRYTEWTEREFTYDINNVVQYTLRSPEYVTSYEYSNSKNKKYKKYITLIYPYPNFKKDFTSTVIYLIDESHLQSIFNKHRYLQNENIIILTEDKKVFSSYHDDFSPAEINRLYNQIGDKQSFKYIMNNEEYLINAVHSGATDLIYVSLCPTSEYMSKINGVQKRLIYTLVVVLIVGTLLISIFMHNNYKPIVSIYNQLDASNQSSHYLQDIHEGMKSISHENKKLRDIIMDYQPGILYYQFHKILSGAYTSIEDYQADHKQPLLHFPTTSSIRVVVFHFDKGPSCGVMNQLINTIRLQLNDTTGAYCMDSCNPNQLISMISTDHALDICTTLEGFIPLLHSIHPSSCTIGMGNGYKDLRQLPQSLMEAKQAVAYHYIKGNNQVISYNNTELTASRLNWYPHRIFEEIRNAIHLKNQKKINEHIHKFIQYIKECQMPISIIRCMSYEVINMVMKRIYELNVYEAILKKYPFDMLDLTTCSTVDDLEIILSEICNYICQYTHHVPEKLQTRSIDKIMSSIQEECFSCDFSIKMIADRYAMSQSSLSQQFKHFTRKTISHYVDNLRIEKAKSLLKTSKLPIKDIITQIGYYDSSSFTRKFKQMVGLTPGKYRDRYK